MIASNICWLKAIFRTWFRARKGGAVERVFIVAYVRIININTAICLHSRELHIDAFVQLGSSAFNDMNAIHKNVS